MNRDYRINEQGFRDQWRIQLLTRMLAVAGYTEGSPAFMDLAQSAINEFREDQAKSFYAFLQNLSPGDRDRILGKQQPVTATGAQIMENWLECRVAAELSVPENEIQFRDKETGKILGKITNVGEDE